MSSTMLSGALQRAGLLPPSQADRQLIDVGLGRLGAGEDDVLEVTRAFWRTDTHGADALILLTRTTLVVVLRPKMQGFLKKRASAPGCVLLRFDAVKDLIEDDEIDGPAIFFVGLNGEPDFLLRFERAGERNRMLAPIFDAHRGRYARWGLQLDPANYGEDFARFHADLVASAGDDPARIDEWVSANYGEFSIANALGFAQAWRESELQDAAGQVPSSRVMRIANCRPWCDEHSSAMRLILTLGEQLYDDGLLGAPYDERTFDTCEPLTAFDAGPARLVALMTIAGFAHALRDPRAAEWIDAARTGIPHMPPAAIPNTVRELWAQIEELAPKAQQQEIAIWQDADVAAVTTQHDGRVTYEIDALTPTDRALVSAFLDALIGAGAESVEHAEVLAACLLGVRTYEELSPLAAAGWRKFVLYETAQLIHLLWERSRLAHETAMLAQWVTVSIEADGWGPDGNASALGQHHSYAMNLAGRTGIGILTIDPRTNMASAPTGDEARHAAVAGHF